MSWISLILQFDCFLKMSVCVFAWQTFWSKYSSRMYRISWNFIFNVILTLIDVHQLLVKIALQVALYSYFPWNFWDRLISVFNKWNCTKIYTQNIYNISRKQWFNLGTCSLVGSASIRFSANSCNCHTSNSVEWNRTNFFMQYTLKNDIYAIFAGIAY